MPRSIFDPTPHYWATRMLSIFRIVAGLVFISVGTMKMFGYPAGPMPVPPHTMFSQLGIAGILEMVGGVAITLGFLTRPVAFILSGEMAVAYFQFHFPKSFWPTVNMGQPALLYCFFFLYLVFAGAGIWSVDAAIDRARGENPAA